MARLQVSRLKDINHRSRERLEKLTRIQADLEGGLRMQERAKRLDDLLARHRQLDYDMTVFTADLEKACNDLDSGGQMSAASPV